MIKANMNVKSIGRDRRYYKCGLNFTTSVTFSLLSIEEHTHFILFTCQYLYTIIISPFEIILS